MNRNSIAAAMWGVAFSNLALADEGADAASGEGTAQAPDDQAKPVARFMHGFRLGYTYVNGLTNESPLRSPHLFVLGYEATQRAIGGGWLNVITVENFSVSGINQSVFIPSLNGLVGFELREQLQVGTGINVSPFDPRGKYVHQILAVGWTPTVGAFNVPFHVTIIPDLDGNWRLGTTVGVNW